VGAFVRSLWSFTSKENRATSEVYLRVDLEIVCQILDYETKLKYCLFLLR
jgi:hypothetical protein